METLKHPALASVPLPPVVGGLLGMRALEIRSYSVLCFVGATLAMGRRDIHAPLLVYFNSDSPYIIYRVTSE